MAAFINSILYLFPRAPSVFCMILPVFSKTSFLKLPFILSQVGRSISVTSIAASIFKYPSSADGKIGSFFLREIRWTLGCAKSNCSLKFTYIHSAEWGWIMTSYIYYIHHHYSGASMTSGTLWSLCYSSLRVRSDIFMLIFFESLQRIIAKTIPWVSG